MWWCSIIVVVDAGPCGVDERQAANGTDRIADALRGAAEFPESGDRRLDRDDRESGRPAPV